MTSQPYGHLPAAGWYPDPRGTGGQAYWTGTDWDFTKIDAGQRVHSAPFGGKKIEIYANGYVRVAMFMRDSVPFQKLLGIEYSANVRKKTGLGRGAAAVMTCGVNLMSSNKRGDVYLTIVTDEQVYSLREGPSMGSPERGQALAAAGASVIGGLGQ